MVRTRADCSGIRVGSKASFKTTAKSSTPSTSGKRRSGPGNRYHPRETPAWQKEITQFLNPSGSENTPKAKEPVAESVAESVAEPVAEPVADLSNEKAN